MSETLLAANAFLAVVRRDFYIFISYRTRFLTQIASALFSLTLFYYVSRLVSVRQFPSHDDYFAYVVVGLAAMQLLTATVHAVPATLRGELVAGTFERMVAFRYLRARREEGFVSVIAAFSLLGITLGVGTLQWGDAEGVLRHPYYVEHERLRSAAAGSDCAGDFVELAPGPAHQHQFRPGSGERYRAGAPDPAAGAGHQRNFAV